MFNAQPLSAKGLELSSIFGCMDSLSKTITS